jgi:hypothetical protein
MKLDTAPPPVVVSDRFGLLLSTFQCRSCGKRSPCAALWIPSLKGQGGAFDEGCGALLYFVAELCGTAYAHVRSLAHWMSFELSEEAGARYLINHCVHCSKQHGDHLLFAPGGAFFHKSQAGCFKTLILGIGMIRAKAIMAQCPPISGYSKPGLALH